MTQSDGFDIAFGLTVYDGDTSITEDEDYAIVVPYIKRWGPMADEEKSKYYQIDGLGSYYRKLDTSLCTEEEIGVFEQSNTTRFNPVVENSVIDAEVYSKKMKCIRS